MEYTKGEKWEAMRGCVVIATGESPVTGERWEQKIAQCYGENEQKQEANALMIAAAPDMYEALKVIIQKRNEAHETEAAYIPPEIEQAYKALAKAEGK